MVRARRVPAGRKNSVPSAIFVAPLAVSPRSAPPAASPRPASSVASPRSAPPISRIAPPRRVTTVRPQVPMDGAPTDQADTPPVVLPPPLPQRLPDAALRPVALSAVPRHAIPARLVTPTDLRVKVTPASRRPKPRPAPRREPVWSPVDSDEIISAKGSSVGRASTDYTEAAPRSASRGAPFDGVEIAARSGGRLLDIATLRVSGEQYVLGHDTPQGVQAPHVHHTGLRLLRISEGRMVDLVFPGDAAGQLVREGETVTFQALAQGRKYSCLRLAPRDVATVIIGKANRQVAYHIRFLYAPTL